MLFSVSQLKRLTEGKFFRNVAIVATGTAGAQAIAMGFAPIVTRLYGPENFGVLGTFTACLSMAVPLATLSYPIAAVLPETDKEAKVLVKLATSIAFGMSLFVLAFVIINEHATVKLLGLPRHDAAITYLIPLAIFFAAMMTIASQWVIRKKYFLLKSKVVVAHALVANISKVTAGLAFPTALTLVVVATLGSLLHACLLFLGARRKREAEDDEDDGLTLSLTEVARAHWEFPVYRTPQIFLSMASQSLPVIFLAGFFGPASAGYYALARTVLGLPATLVAQAVGDVFFPQITEHVRKKEDAFAPILKATLILGVVGVVPFSILIIFGPWLFRFVFGDGWEVAGVYAQWLSIMLFFNFINRPSIAAVPALGLQRGLLLFEVVSTAVKLIALYIGFSVINNEIFAIALFSSSAAVAYALLIGWVHWEARRNSASTHLALGLTGNEPHGPLSGNREW